MRYIGWLTVVALLVGTVACGGEDTSQTATASRSSEPAPTVTVPATTATTSTTSTTSTTTTTVAAPLLRRGDSGPAVAAVQQQLRDLGYWFSSVDAVDGIYDETTAHAVTAFQKRSGLERDGVAGPLTLGALASASRPRAISASGHIVEIDLATQTLMLVDGGLVQWVFDVSTGARTGTTPEGHFTVFRQVNGYDHSPLGVLYRPKYFYRGVAIHGYPSVPSYPASHGCVRVLNAAMDWLWATGSLDIGTEVLVS